MENTTAIEKRLADNEYREFCQQCARERLSVPSRADAIAIKAKFVGGWQGRPAWIQLRAFPGQYSVKLWLVLEREQVLMELERQSLTPPQRSKSEASMLRAAERFINEPSQAIQRRKA